MIARFRRVLRPVRRMWRAAIRPTSEHFATRRELAELGEPVTFNEKVRYKMLKDRRPLLRVFADKLAVRDYVASRVGASVLPELHVVTTRPEAIAESELPREFALKPSHGSGACVLVADFAPLGRQLSAGVTEWTQLLVRPDRLEWDRLIELCRYWLSHGFTGYRNEWCYRNLPRRILVEELLVDGGGVPIDFKFFVFHGRTRMIQVDFHRFENHARDLYTPSWERHEGRSEKYPRGVEIEPPDALDEMLAIAEVLGAETDFVRVDLYCIGKRIVFGELTNYPEASGGGFDPADFDLALGHWWTPPKRYGRQVPRRLGAPRVPPIDQL